MAILRRVRLYLMLLLYVPCKYIYQIISYFINFKISKGMILNFSHKIHNISNILTLVDKNMGETKIFHTIKSFKLKIWLCIIIMPFRTQRIIGQGLDSSICLFRLQFCWVHPRWVSLSQFQSPVLSTRCAPVFPYFYSTEGSNEGPS